MWVQTKPMNVKMEKTESSLDRFTTNMITSQIQAVPYKNMLPEKTTFMTFRKIENKRRKN